MVTITFATTFPINPSSSTPVLTAEQMWQGLVKKCIRPQDFVPVMSDCEVESQTEEEIVRTVSFKEGMGPGGKAGRVKEVIRLVGGCIVIFDQPTTSSRVTNTISHGSSGSEDLYLTFTFEWAHPEISAGSKEEGEKRTMYEGMGLTAVGHTIEVVRQMVGRGEV